MAAFVCVGCKNTISAAAEGDIYLYEKSLSEDEVWNEYQQKFLEMGGNEPLM